MKMVRFLSQHIRCAHSCCISPFQDHTLAESRTLFLPHSRNSVGSCLNAGYLNRARHMFDQIPSTDFPTWTPLVSAYTHHGLPKEAIKLFSQFHHLHDMGINHPLKLNSATLSSVLHVCTNSKYLKFGKQIHALIAKLGFQDCVLVSSNLMRMYAICSSLTEAETVFDSMTKRDIVTWNIIIGAYFSNKEFEKGFELFSKLKSQQASLSHASWNTAIRGCIQSSRTEQALNLLIQMQVSGFRPNKITVATILPDLESLNSGREIHGYIYRQKFHNELATMTGLIFMYAKCGEFKHSFKVFRLMTRKDTVVWNTMILASSMHGKGKEALNLFHEMLRSQIKPNSFTFGALLSGCSHSRLVDEGFHVFNSMTEIFKVKPDLGHYSCMVDLLGRAGQVKEAYEFIQRMPMAPGSGAWGALLASCRVYKNVELGKLAAKKLFEIKPEIAANYILLYNILATSKLWDEAFQVLKVMREKGVRKTVGCSWVEVKNRVYSFVAGEKRNERNTEIFKFLKGVDVGMRLGGVVPNTDFVGLDLDEEEKEEALCGHSEKLAVAFGVLNHIRGSSIRVFKNLRICVDCHSTIKFISKSIGLRIIVRDSLRFHHFENGLCSCGDFW